MVRKPIRDVTDAELAVLQVLWNESSLTVRQIVDQLYPAGGESDYATVKKLLSRLESKGFVSRDASQMTHRFSAELTQEQLIEMRLSDVAADLCDGDSTPLVMNLLKNRKYSARERRQLHALFDELFGKNRKK